MTMTVQQDEVKGKGQAGPRDKVQLSGWMLVWFYATAVICTWDATFIMLRPHSLPGGSLATLFYHYKYYVTVDQRYMDTSDAFVFAQSLLNYAEVVFNIVTIIMHYRSSRHTTTTAFMVSVMTMWKTVLYFLMFSEFCAGDGYRKGNTLAEEFFLVVIPNIIWIIVPLCVMFALWQNLTPTAQDKVVASQTHWKSEINGHHFSQDTSEVCNGHSKDGSSVSNGRAKGYVNGEAVVIKRNIN